MRWRQLQAFKLTMSTGTVSGAAEVLGISQPAASRLLEALETELKFDLFNRATGRLVPTVEAQLFYEEVLKAFVSYDRLANVAIDIRSGRRGSLHIACMPAIGLGFLPRVIGAFAKTQPDVHIRYDIQLSPRVQEWVSSQQVDLGIAEFPFSSTGFESEEFCKVPYVVALPQGTLDRTPVKPARRNSAEVRIVSLPGNEQCATLSIFGSWRQASSHKSLARPCSGRVVCARKARPRRAGSSTCSRPTTTLAQGSSSSLRPVVDSHVGVCTLGISRCLDQLATPYDHARAT